MGRMFRIITEGGADARHPADRGPTVLPADDVPYVEVGGPEGVVTSIPRPAPPPRAVVPVPPVVVAPEPEPEPCPEPGPMQAAGGRVLSVAFHRFPKSGLRLLPAGVSADVVAYHDPDHPVAAEYRAVRDEVARQFDEPGPRAVLFTAAAPAAGTTTVLLNLGVALAQGGSARVLVVDGGFDRPAVARRLGVADAPGLAEVIGQAVPLAWAVQPTAVPNLHVLAAGASTAETEPGLAADFPRLLVQLRQWFDWVLVDGGTWLPGRDGGASACDAVYVVTRQADIDRPEFAGLRASVAAGGGVLRGYVTTRQ